MSGQSQRICSVSLNLQPSLRILLHQVARTSLVAQTAKNSLAMQETGFDPWVRKDPLEKKWQPTPVFLPGESHGWRGLAN